MFTIYQITHKKTGQYYIGVHEGALGSYWGSGKYLRAAIKKHGKSCFSRCVLGVVQTESMAYALERLVVNDLFIGNANTYNLIPGGGHPPIHRHWGSRVFSSIHRQRISEAKQGKPHSLTTRQKISQSLIGNQRGLGHTHSEENKQKMREAAKRRELRKQQLVVVVGDN